MIRRHILLTLALLCAASTCLHAAGLEQIARSVTIYRDNYGVPHVYGPTDASCVFGYVYAQAEDNFWQIEDNYIQALGFTSDECLVVVISAVTRMMLEKKVLLLLGMPGK